MASHLAVAKPLHDASWGNSLTYTRQLVTVIALSICYCIRSHAIVTHDDVIKWKHFLRYWPFVRNGQWRGALMFSLICVWINGWENNREAGDLGRYLWRPLWRHCNVKVAYNKKSFCIILQVTVNHKLDIIIGLSRHNDHEIFNKTWLCLFSVHGSNIQISVMC